MAQSKLKRKKKVVKKKSGIRISPYEEGIFLAHGWTNYQIGLASKDSKARRALRGMHQQSPKMKAFGASQSIFGNSGRARSVSPSAEGYSQSLGGASRPVSAYLTNMKRVPSQR